MTTTKPIYMNMIDHLRELAQSPHVREISFIPSSHPLHEDDCIHINPFDYDLSRDLVIQISPSSGTFNIVQTLYDDDGHILGNIPLYGDEEVLSLKQAVRIVLHLMDPAVPIIAFLGDEDYDTEHTGSGLAVVNVSPDKLADLVIHEVKLDDKGYIKGGVRKDLWVTVK